MGSFSKVLFPAVRVGYLVLPPDLVELFVTARALGHGSLMEQAEVADFIAEGHFTRHLRRMWGLYAECQAELVEAAKRDLAGRIVLDRGSPMLCTVGQPPVACTRPRTPESHGSRTLASDSGNREERVWGLPR